jgi:hypothetical protein
LARDGAVKVRAVIFLRGSVFIVGVLIAASAGVSCQAGFVLVSSAIMLHRFYFEIKDKQKFFNLISVGEKVVLCAVLVVVWQVAGSGRDTILLLIATSWKIAVSVYFAWFVYRNTEDADRNVIKLNAIILMKVGAPFFLSYLFIQLAAVIASAHADIESLADYGTASQIGSALVTAVTFWQRPVIRKYFASTVNIKSEMIGAGFITFLAIGVLILFVNCVGDIFHLRGSKSIIWGFLVYSLMFSILHPLELDGYTSGNIATSRFVRGSAITGLLCIPSALVAGFWAVPILMLTNTLTVVWMVRRN